MTTTVFLHIDRTGGMSVRNEFAKHFAFAEIRPVPHHHQARLQGNSYPKDYHADLIAQHKVFTHNPVHKLVMGHWDAGILDKIDGDKQVFTILRNPIERVKSLGRYMSIEPMYMQYHQEFARLGMLDFLYKYKSLWTNVMSQQLAGTRWTGGHYDFKDALINLDKLDFVGFTEDLNEYTTILGMDIICHPTLNDSYKTLDLSSALAEMIANESLDDIQLYRIAQKRREHAIQQSNLS